MWLWRCMQSSQRHTHTYTQTETCFPQRQKTLLSYCTHALTLLYLLPDEISTRPLEMLTSRRPCGKSGLGAGQADTERQIEMAGAVE